MKQTIYIPVTVQEATHIVKPVTLEGVNDEIIPVKPVEMPTKAEIEVAIHDICVLEERLTRHYQAAQQPLDEIRKLQQAQREAITKLMKGEK